MFQSVGIGCLVALTSVLLSLAKQSYDSGLKKVSVAHATALNEQVIPYSFGLCRAQPLAP